MALNNRLYFACAAAGFAGLGSQTFTVAHGLTSVSQSCNFNLETFYEIGQLAPYDIWEDVPSCEVSLEKNLDGYPLIYHLATPGATDSAINGRCTRQSIMAMSLFADVVASASGTPLNEVQFSGLYVSSLNYSFPVDGNATESVTLVGNSVAWKAGASAAFTGQLFDNTDTAFAAGGGSGGIQRREDIMYQGQANITLLPADIPGVSSSGTQTSNADGSYPVHLQSITVSADLGKEEINELGHRAPYYRYTSYPIDVTTTFEVICTSGFMTTANVNTSLSNRTIQIVPRDGTKINTGGRNKLQSVQYGGGGVDGSNATMTFTYTTQNALTITHPLDPSAL